MSDQLDRIEAKLDELLTQRRALSGETPAVQFRHGKRPKFWRDAEVRDAVIAAYPNMTLMDAVASLKQRFGARAPSKSAIHRFWSDHLAKKRRAA